MLRDGTYASVGVEVPWLPVKCPNCAVFGHNERNCAKSCDSTRVAPKVWMAKTVTPVVPVVSSDVVYVPEVPSEVVVPVSGVGDSTVSGVVGPTTTDFGKVAIVEGTTASASVKGGKHPWNPLVIWMMVMNIGLFERLPRMSQ
ncbi:hypothetical protein V6N12_007929 [Hibiscus sabdariffa]|uniref:Zinc knuckle CX2CX4HX4C n=1 Tax=Hibiscus sabdariffa TaxID=183260 RepID=A0ABR2A1S9_9ROSI